MTSEYTPTTDDLRLAYENHRGLCLAETMRDQGDSFIPGVEAGEDFDRWLAAHDAEVAAKALDDFAAHVTPDGDPSDCTTIYDPYDVAEMALARAAGIREGAK